MAKQPKDLNMFKTYYDNVCCQNMSDSRYHGLRLIPSKTASLELLRNGCAIEDCKEILINGYSPRKRGKGTIERWMDKGSKTFNVVIVKSFNFMYDEYVYLITHFGRFTKRK